jgi:proteasome assembly chaperone 3
MPVPMGSNIPTNSNEMMDLPYPATTKQAAGLVNGVPTDVMMISFADKIMITITQNGRLAQWVCTLILLK